mmetsp:Transcript_8637/g.19580  ORF Transcript_8637/g.19580 Transcript_8637/m.19580 type:complete len:213 (-) Transcript_8637:174-812(-)
MHHDRLYEGRRGRDAGRDVANSGGQEAFTEVLADEGRGSCTGRRRHGGPAHLSDGALVGGERAVGVGRPDALSRAHDVWLEAPVGGWPTGGEVGQARHLLVVAAARVPVVLHVGSECVVSCTHRQDVLGRGGGPNGPCSRPVVASSDEDEEVFVVEDELIDLLGCAGVRGGGGPPRVGVELCPDAVGVREQVDVEVVGEPEGAPVGGDVVEG